MKKLLYKLLLYLNYLVVLLLLLAYLSVYISPADVWIFSFLGLAYPYLLIFNLIFVGWWVYRKKMVFLISLVAIIIGWNYLASYFQIPLTEEKRDKVFQEEMGKDSSLKVMSYNVRLFNRYNWAHNEEAKSNIFAFIKKQDPDVVCLQEFYANPSEGLSLQDIEQKLSFLPYHHVFFTLQQTRQQGYGLAIFSRYPLVSKSVIRFPESLNATIYTDLKRGKDTLRIFNNHLQSIRFRKNNMEFFNKLRFQYNEKQIQELKDISNRLKQAVIKRAHQVDTIKKELLHSPYPVILTGDFNDPPTSYAYYTLKKDGLKDAFTQAGKWTGNTYIGKMPSFRIDYILYSESLSAYTFRTWRVKHSDHYPLTTYIVP